MYEQLLSFAVSRGSRKPKFQYRLPLIGPVCRTAWVLAAGYLNPKTSRIVQNEARIRKGFKAPKVRKSSRRLDLLNQTTYMHAFMRDYILKHAQRSPSDTILYVSAVSVRTMYDKYKAERAGYRILALKTFQKGWSHVLCSGVTDPETSLQYEVRMLKSRAKGFAKCNRCQYLKMRLAGTSDQQKKAVYKRKLTQHLEAIMDGREEIARVHRLCSTDRRHKGFYIDAADSNKFQLPTTMSVAKMMSKLWRIRQKLTVIQCFDMHKHLYFFRTLPDVPTGANLTATIICRYLDIEDMTQVTDLHIHVDGAGDNINYNLMYTFIHILRAAKAKGWPLRRIHLYRPKSGHSHCDIDSTFALVSRFIYGKHSNGDSRKNIFSFSHFKTVCTC